MWAVRSMAAMALAAAGALQAQDYPSRPVRLIVASSSGSGVDIIARVVAQRMTEALGVQMVVDNRAGAGGTIGVQTVAKSPPDGYTLLMAAPSFPINSMLMKPAPYDVLRDFTPVGQATTSQYAIVLHPQDVAERAAHHHLVVAAPRAVRVELERATPCSWSQAPAGDRRDRAGRRDVVGRHGVAEDRQDPGALDVGDRRRHPRPGRRRTAASRCRSSAGSQS